MKRQRRTSYSDTMESGRRGSHATRAFLNPGRGRPLGSGIEETRLEWRNLHSMHGGEVVEICLIMGHCGCWLPAVAGTGQEWQLYEWRLLNICM